ncbi:MAG: TetR/AcrR family transcriptional regulator, partial [Tomitella sp.]|nr:TetR/AcrR family transcriptional regulator [Tomitella sp.]
MRKSPDPTSLADPVPKATRMSRDDRREQVLAAATEVFARGGFAGTSTDEVAKAAGVSQPYVVRMFGGKAELFLAVLRTALERTVDAFADELDHISIDPENGEFWAELGHAYNRLAADGVHAQV